MYHRPDRLPFFISSVEFNPSDSGGSQSKPVRTEGGTACKDSDSFVASEPWRADGRLEPPAGTLPCLGEFPNNPDVVEIFQPPQGIRIAVPRFEDNPARQVRGKAGLSGYPELGRERGVEICYRLNLLL